MRKEHGAGEAPNPPTADRAFKGATGETGWKGVLLPGTRRGLLLLDPGPWIVLGALMNSARLTWTYVAAEPMRYAAAQLPSAVYHTQFRYPSECSSAVRNSDK
eukprot:7390143-Prymnesium_polylepis.2